jgi:hypothetical protein
MNMKNILFAFLLLPQVFFAQKHDYIWVSGDSNDPAITTHGGIIIDFNQNPINAYYNYRKLNMFVCNASICDTSGNLVAYTNGCDIAGADDEIILNGENINPGYVHNLKCDQENDGYSSGIQSAVILPLPDTVNIYYLFHKRIVYASNPFDVITDALFFSIIDMNENGGKGSVLLKNKPLMTGSIAFGELSAVKHSNGKDWWLVTPKRNSNSFYTFLFTQNGITDTLEQTIGSAPSPSGEGGGQTGFSPDGTMLIRQFPFDSTRLYWFDRATGFFTEYKSFYLDYGDDMPWGGGAVFSPDSKVLYVTSPTKVYQFNLTIIDIEETQQTVAVYDGYANPLPTTFWQCMLGPDCKIYIKTGQETSFYHVIHHPNELGISCNVEQRGLPLPTPHGSSMPSFPNYRLGPVDNPGVPCTATVGTQAPPTPLPVFSVFPNPVSAALKVVPNRQFGGQARVRLFDVTGRMALEEIFDPQSTCTELDVRALPDGMYFYEIWSEGRVARAGKVFKVE